MQLSNIKVNVEPQLGETAVASPWKVTFLQGLFTYSFTMNWGPVLGGSLLSTFLLCHEGPHQAVTESAIAVASLLSSIAGFAFSAICGAMLFHLSDDPVKIVQIMITCSIANQAAMTWASRRDIQWRGLLVFLMGGTIGLPIGVWLLLHTDRFLYIQALGLFLLAYGSYMLVRKPLVINGQRSALDFICGLLGGITGGAVGFPGAFVTIWCGMKGWDKTRQRAVFQPFILFMQVAALLTISVASRSSSSSIGFDLSDLLFVPPALLGTAFGLALYRRLSDLQFARAVNVLLIVSGMSYIL